eukprot:1661240-Pyramimonas_sp.AAC.1
MSCTIKYRGAVGACERWHLGLRSSSRWGHDACEGYARIGAVGACERWHLGLRWGSLGPRNV